MTNSLHGTISKHGIYNIEMFRLKVSQFAKAIQLASNRRVSKFNLYCNVRQFSSSDNKAPSGKAPENFFDVEVEMEKEFSDISSSMELGGLHKLTALEAGEFNEKMATEEILEFERVMAEMNNFTKEGSGGDAAKHAELSSLIQSLQYELDEVKTEPTTETDINVAMEDVDSSDEESDEEYGLTEDNSDDDSDAAGSDDDAEEDDEGEGEEDALLEGRLLNPNDHIRTDEQYPDELLENFIPTTSEHKNDSYSQGYRACPGKLQRRGINPELLCHKVDLDAITYTDVQRLHEFMTEDGEILPKTETGLCAKCQRKVAKTIKSSRCMGLLPHIGQFTVADGRPEHKAHQKFHDASPSRARRIVSKTIL